ncbi:hypothetical protein B4U80_12715 [Leptotrombidium deliense]|uniref:Uncharacterized protein n=1 Tax=Leptotrombidium deliense TaxID=299467 RepID=A0A443SPW1_9ACAR|nr:hypothetical protein B4U80_12715 [Leptotrombidium deliense]
MSWNTNGNSIASHSILQQQSVGQELKNLLDAAFKLNDVTANSNKTKFAIILKNLRIEIERQLGVITMQWSHFDIDSKDVATLHEWNVRPHQRAKTIGFISCEARLNSFADWPEVAAVKPEGLADAGFFYVGKKSNLFLVLNVFQFGY